MLESPGGSLTGGVGMGEVIRDANLMTLVPSGAECASACAFAFIGGTRRTVLEGGRLGMHQFRWEDEQDAAFGVQTAQAFAGILMAYFRHMGIDSEALTIAMMTPPREMHYFTREELTRFGIVTLGPAEQVSAAPPCPFPAEHSLNDPLNLYPSCH